MSWIDSLTPADIAELESHLDRFGSATAFELYLVLTIAIAMHGPFRGDELARWIEGYGDLDWHRIKGQFEFRNSQWNIKRWTPPGPPAGRVRA